MSGPQFTAGERVLECANMRHQERAVCVDPVTSIDAKGYVYCKACAAMRRSSQRVRRLDAAELAWLRKAPLPCYDKRECAEKMAREAVGDGS